MTRTVDPSLTFQLSRLKRADPAERLGIAEDIAAQASVAPGQLVRALKDSDWHIRWGAAHALGRSLVAAAPALRPLLEDPQPRVARTAAWALGRLRDEGSVADLERALHSSNSHLSAAAAWALGHIGTTESLEALAGALDSASSRALRSISLAFAEIGPGASASLVGLLQNGSVSERTRAAQVLSRFGLLAAPLLLPMLDSPEVKHRRAAAHILGTLRLGRLNKEGLPTPDLQEGIDKDAAQEIVSDHQYDEPVSQDLEDGARLVRQVEQRLVAALKDEDLRVRRNAARSVGALGFQASRPDLEALLEGDDELARVAANALAALGDQAAGSALQSALDRRTRSQDTVETEPSRARGKSTAEPGGVEAALDRALVKLGLAPRRERRPAPKPPGVTKAELPSRYDFLATVTPGLESVAWEEIAGRMTGASLRSFGDGVVVFRWTGNAQAGAVLRSIRQLYQGGAFPKEIALAKRLRRYRVSTLPASLEPTTAYALARLANLGERDIFVDLMCGAGTIAIERALDGPAHKIIAGDIDPVALHAARQNIDAGAQPVTLVRWDARRLPLPDESVSAAVANLPYGRRSGSQLENRHLYPAVLQELQRVLRNGGTAVLLTTERRLIHECLEKTEQLKLVSEQETDAGGLRPAVFILQK